MTDVINDANAYGVKIIPAAVDKGDEYWKIVRIHHLTPEENQKRHHIFIDAIDETGKNLPGSTFLIRWEGGSETVTTQAQPSGPGANFPMWKWQVCSIEGANAHSDIAVNLRTDHPDEGTLNTLFHHSFAITFMRTVARGKETPAFSTLRGRIPQGSTHTLELWDADVIVKVVDVGDAQTYRFDNLPAGVYTLRDRSDGRIIGPFTLDGRHEIVADFPIPLPEGKVFANYFMIGDAAAPETELYTTLLADYLAKNGYAFGFSPAEAALAAIVHVIGEPPEETVQTLTTSHCKIVQWPAEPEKLLQVLQDGGPS